MTGWSIFAFDTGVDPGRLALDCAAWGMRRAVLHPGYLRDDRFADALRAHGRELWLNLPVFHAPEHLQAHPDHYAVTSGGERAIHGWLHMACPSADDFLEARRHLFSALLDRVRPSVLSLDFLRFHVFWEEVPLDGDPAAVLDGCYCPRCLASFSRFAGERPARGADGRIVPAQWTAWARWKTDRITAVAAELVALIRRSAPGVPLFVKTVPWGAGVLGDAARRVAGQDLEALAGLSDGAIPMALLHVLGRDPGWKRGLLDEAERRTGKPVPSYVQVEPITGGSIPLADLQAEIEAVLSERRAPVVFHYEQLVKDPARAALVRALARRADPGSAE